MKASDEGKWNMKKGISPLIASVLLIAFVMATAGIVSNWFVTFSKQQSEETVERGEEEIECSYSSIDIRNVKYNETNKKIRFEVKNSGSIDLTDIKIQAIYKNDTTSDSLKPGDWNKTLNVGEIKIYSDTGHIDSNIRKVSIYSEDCAVKSRAWMERAYITFIS